MAFAGMRNRRRDSRAAGQSLTSPDNRWLKRFRASLAGDPEDGDGLIGAEGVRLVEAALASGCHIEALLVSPSGERHLPRLEGSILRGTRMLRTSDALFARIAGTRSPQGVAALVRPKTATLEDVVRGMALVVVLVGVQDPGNVGTILRAAETFGATGAATCIAGTLGTANPLAPKALRASAGAALRLPILRGISMAILFTQLRVLGVRLYAATPNRTEEEEPQETPGPPIVRPWEADWQCAVALLIGNEGAGLPGEVVRSADARVSIPNMAEAKAAESLNAAMAGTVLLYEAMRQRGRLA